MTERDLLRLVHSIVLATRRARKLNCPKLTRALDTAGYYAGLKLGEHLAVEHERDANAEQEPKR